MAISEDTLALVAAQLTTAWAIKTGVEQEHTPLPNTLKFVGIYNNIHAQLKQSVGAKR